MPTRDSAQAAKAKLEKLLEHGRANAWNPAHDVDWDATTRKLEGLDGNERQALGAVLSLVFHSDAQGRQILESLCRGLDKTPATHLSFSEKAHEFFIQQMDDEDRHASGLRLLFDRLGLQIEAPRLSHSLYSRLLLSDRCFDAKLIMIYWYIEILAKSIFEQLKKRFPDTCIDSLFRLIIRDEARHVGFGEVYMPLHVEQSGTMEKGQMALAYYSSAAALPGLFRFSHYAKAARVLNFDIDTMLSKGMKEIGAKAAKLPSGTGLVDLASILL